MRVCLVIPPSSFLLDQRVFLSLGVLKVAASLEQAGHTVDVLDLSGVKDYEKATADYVRDHPSTYQYGITATTPQMPAAVKVRAQIPCRIVYLGGPHVTLVHAAYKDELKRGVDAGRARKALEKLLALFGVLVAGDGEHAVHAALNAKEGQIINGDDPSTGLFLNHRGFDESPWPARHLVDMDSYHYYIEGAKATSIVAQLGCPFGCNFCGGRLSPMLRRVRLRTTESIISELRFLYERYHYTGFMFYDDELNVNPKLLDLLKAIYQLQVELKVEFKLRGFVKAELFTVEQAQWLYIAGFRWLLCGFESGSERILTNINKRANRADNSRMLSTARQAGLKVKALMSLGHPGESPQTIADTRAWLLQEKPDDFDATVITVYPGTPYYDSAVEVAPGEWCFTTAGDRLYHQDLDFTLEQAFYKGIPGEYKSFVWSDYLTAPQLVEEREALERDVRRELKLSFPPAPFESSMGQVTL